MWTYLMYHVNCVNAMKYTRLEDPNKGFIHLKILLSML